MDNRCESKISLGEGTGVLDCTIHMFTNKGRPCIILKLPPIIFVHPEVARERECPGAGLNFDTPGHPSLDLANLSIRLSCKTLGTKPDHSTTMNNKNKFYVLFIFLSSSQLSRSSWLDAHPRHIHSPSHLSKPLVLHTKLIRDPRPQKQLARQAQRPRPRPALDIHHFQSIPRHQIKHLQHMRHQ